MRWLPGLGSLALLVGCDLYAPVEVARPLCDTSSVVSVGPGVQKGQLDQACLVGTRSVASGLRIDLPGIGHMVNLEAAPAFDRALLEFLARRSAPADGSC